MFRWYEVPFYCLASVSFLCVIKLDTKLINNSDSILLSMLPVKARAFKISHFIVLRRGLHAVVTRASRIAKLKRIGKLSSHSVTHPAMK